MLNTRLDYLFRLYMAQQASAAEKEEMMHLIADKANEDQVNELFEDAWQNYKFLNPVFDSSKSEEILDNVMKAAQISQHKVKHLQLHRVWGRIAIAASVIFMLSAGVFFYTKISKKSQFVAQKVKPQFNITPGSNKAILILANGSKITLDDATNGEIAKQTGIKITKTKKGQLIYATSDTKNLAQNVTPIYNTIAVPRGGQWEVTLADGSKVWLNSASTLRYPTTFTGNERKVELTGEAYFEVAKNKERPFRVVSYNQIIEVLGTHFNVNAYADEAKTKTTLLEGSVKIFVKNTQTTAILKPGQQSVLSTSNSLIEVREVDTEDAVAWKNGYFMFPNEHIESIMRKISRWYDVDIAYSGKIPQKAIWGSVSKFKNVTEVLNMLQETGCVHFKIDGRRIMVMP